jgi:hypothetical protein
MRAVAFRSATTSPQAKYHEPVLQWNFVLTRLKIDLSHEKQRRNSYAFADSAKIHLQRYETTLGPPDVIELSPLHLWLAFADPKLH